MMKHGQSEKPTTSSATQHKTTPRRPRKKRIYFIRLLLGVFAISSFIVLTQVNADGWEAISHALFGGYTVQDVARYMIIVILSMMVGYWIKRPRRTRHKRDDEKKDYSEENE